MIYQSRSKNLVTNYLKNVDNQLLNKGAKKMGVGSSRNQAIAAPQGTKLLAKTNNYMDSQQMKGNDTNKSLIGGRYY